MKAPLKELSFIVKLVSVIVAASLLAFAVLYLFMDTWVGTDYGIAFKVISEVYGKMNYYIATAVLAQLIISSIAIFFLALHYSHKIAGPIYRLKLAMQQYVKGQDIAKVTFRKTDFLHEIAEQFSDFFRFMRRRGELFEATRELLEKADLNDEEKKQGVLRKVEKILLELTE